MTSWNLESIVGHSAWHDKCLYTAAAFGGGDNVVAYWCPQVSPPPDKLSQVRLHRGNCEFGVPHLGLSVNEIISRPFLVLASLERRSLEIMVVVIFWSMSTTSRPLLLQALGFFQAFSNMSFAMPEARGGIEFWSLHV